MVFFAAAFQLRTFVVRSLTSAFTVEFFVGPFCRALFLGASSALSFAGVFLVRSLTGDVLVHFFFDFLLAFLCGASFRAVSAEGFPFAFLQRLVCWAFS